MSIEHGIQVGQIWRSKTTGREVRVKDVMSNYLVIESLKDRRYTYPWITSFLKQYEPKEVEHDRP